MTIIEVMVSAFKQDSLDSSRRRSSRKLISTFLRLNLTVNGPLSNEELTLHLGGHVKDSLPNIRPRFVNCSQGSQYEPARPIVFEKRRIAGKLVVGISVPKKKDILSPARVKVVYAGAQIMAGRFQPFFQIRVLPGIVITEV